MLYRLYPQTNETRIFKEKNSRSKIPYCTAKKMRELYPGTNYAEALGCPDMLLISTGKAVPIFPGEVIKPFEWIAGYIAVGKTPMLPR